MKYLLFIFCYILKNYDCNIALAFGRFNDQYSNKQANNKSNKQPDIPLIYVFVSFYDNFYINAIHALNNVVRFNNSMEIAAENVECYFKVPTNTCSNIKLVSENIEKNIKNEELSQYPKTFNYILHGGEGQDFENTDFTNPIINFPGLNKLSLEITEERDCVFSFTKTDLISSNDIHKKRILI